MRGVSTALALASALALAPRAAPACVTIADPMQVLVQAPVVLVAEFLSEAPFDGAAPSAPDPRMGERRVLATLRTVETWRVRRAPQHRVLLADGPLRRAGGIREGERVFGLRLSPAGAAPADRAWRYFDREGEPVGLVVDSDCGFRPAVLPTSARVTRALRAAMRDYDARRAGEGA